MTPKQKFELAFKSATDPVTFIIAGVDAGISQFNNDYAGYGQARKVTSNAGALRTPIPLMATSWATLCSPCCFIKTPAISEKRWAPKKTGCGTPC